MFFRILLLFIAVPLFEIYTILLLGRSFGILPTVLTIVLTGFIGAYIAKLQGFYVLYRIRDNLRMGVLPAEELLEGLILLLAGIILLIPGLFTDIVGLILLTKPGRRALLQRIRDSLRPFRGREDFTYREIFIDE
ncbi:MAG: FxsA family protein [Fibrobacterota bacterium]